MPTELFPEVEVRQEERVGETDQGLSGTPRLTGWDAPFTIMESRRGFSGRVITILRLAGWVLVVWTLMTLLNQLPNVPQEDLPGMDPMEVRQAVTISNNSGANVTSGTAVIFDDK